MALPFLGTDTQRQATDIRETTAQAESRVQNEEVLSRIGETISGLTPVITGTVAGVFSNVPFVGLATAFVSDKVKEARREKAERRKQKRLENRQRREAADILVAQGEVANKREALAMIDEGILRNAQKAERQRQENLLSSFDIGETQNDTEQQREENTQTERDNLETRVENAEIEKETLQGMGAGLALESTVANIDNNISAIGDLILDRFADQEKNEEEQRLLQRQQLIQQRELRLEEEREPERDDGEPLRVRQGEDGGSITGSLLRNPIVGIILAVGAVVGAIALFKDDLIDAVIGLPSTIANSLFEKIFGTSGADRESVRANTLESDVKTLQGRKTEAQEELAELQNNIQRLEEEKPTKEEIENARAVIEKEKDDIFKSSEFREARSVLGRASSPALERQKEIANQVQERIQRIDKQIQEKQTTIQELRGDPLSDASEVVPSDPKLGENIANVSFGQKGGGGAPIAVDASNKSSSTTSVINQETQVQVASLGTISDANGKFHGRMMPV